MGLIKVFLYGVIGGIFGLSIGLSIGSAIAFLGVMYNLDRSLLFISSFLCFGSFIFFFLLPREQYFFWRKIEKIHGIKNDGLFAFAPISFFLTVGMGIGIRHGCDQFIIC